MRALRVVEGDLVAYRHAWRGSVMISFISPVLYLAAMGLGLGSLVHHSPAQLSGGSYLDFIAPGLLTATAMQTAMNASSYPIMRKIRWDRLYDAMLATPLEVGDLVTGEALFLALRLIQVSAVFVCVMLLFGAAHPAEVPVIVLAGLLTGLAFGLPMLAVDAVMRSGSGFSAINRFVIIPLFLLSGTFFPIRSLPAAFQWLAWALPLAHGTALARAAAQGTLGLGGALVHCAVLLAYSGIAFWWARRLLQRRLQP